ncbi:unnamed protein product [Didymodactylos carnosus]|uniref:Uncharacterized protein n=1 Tax=Didymodactylos carnosus TaxID=1234261 RepID=A0A813TD76_9BILA|nr:unnamed protein product [Didymodactylos carnosus]CAF1126606.1 unnamed protein product [Didymodactylos carnosus]CAF3592939.1 unnamed protein product [Didymodactylos carnosus]CAF3905204.1 unnamed protein product [Didymodactylos carnosus]
MIASGFLITISFLSPITNWIRTLIIEHLNSRGTATTFALILLLKLYRIVFAIAFKFGFIGNIMFAYICLSIPMYCLLQLWYVDNWLELLFILQLPLYACFRFDIALLVGLLNTD